MNTAVAHRATGRPRARRCLGVRAVLAESYERIHRSNLVGMGVLPLQFKPGQNAASLGLTGKEEFDVLGLSKAWRRVKRSRLRVRDDKGERNIEVIARLDGPSSSTTTARAASFPAVLALAGVEPEAAGESLRPREELQTGGTAPDRVQSSGTGRVTAVCPRQHQER